MILINIIDDLLKIFIATTKISQVSTIVNILNSILNSKFYCLSSTLFVVLKFNSIFIAK